MCSTKSQGVRPKRFLTPGGPSLRGVRREEHRQGKQLRHLMHETMYGYESTNQVKGYMGCQCTIDDLDEGRTKVI
jgi:hypothetical protein